MVDEFLSDPQKMLVFIGIPAYAALYVFSKFDYWVEDRRFVVRWRLLGVLPIYRRSFPLDNLVCVRRFKWPSDFFSRATPLGNTFSSERTIVEFTGIRLRRLAITPTSFCALRAALEPYLSARPEGGS